ncbi:hypothetical protein MCBMB27_04999 [Methylobacterium phyllosphaerae]|uniref:Uncharacterized protein n=1 Tax=Methylobacterium phyllosphaerae TaxID=418223 RepID=A0AAE8L6D8_9HYPH|nr:hypothetical protein [Methylobacterium phyllosphaerae]APT34290.1 hypothetical protein MCBMB27_04999 [Methylobacterium phyllosphaerae]SFG86244.1 hypothetical protein SAMN05192567_10957 [Methylobacterium phyllosphaerae]
MVSSAPPEKDPLATAAEAVADLPTNVFVTRWQQITGEPPAILLNSYSEMIALLVASVPMAPFPRHGPEPDEAGLDPGAGRDQKEP